MSIATDAKVKELEQSVQQLRAAIAVMNERIARLEAPQVPEILKPREILSLKR